MTGARSGAPHEDDGSGERDIDAPTGSDTAPDGGSGEQQRQRVVEIPASELSEDALLGVIEAFVLREGTDYGELELGLTDKVSQVRAQIQRGEAAITFDPDTASVSVVVKI